MASLFDRACFALLAWAIDAARPTPASTPKPLRPDEDAVTGDARTLSLFSSGRVKDSRPFVQDIIDANALHMDLAHKLDLDIALDVSGQQPPRYFVSGNILDERVQIAMACNGRLIMRTSLDYLHPSHARNRPAPKSG
jgi:hypothetical protein